MIDVEDKRGIPSACLFPAELIKNRSREGLKTVAIGHMRPSVSVITLTGRNQRGKLCAVGLN